MPDSLPTTLSRCPVCKKTDPLGPDSPACPRCGCDLTKSGTAHAAARRHTLAAAASLRAADYDDALEHAAYAWSLACLPAIPPLACMAALLARRLPDLARWRTRLPSSRQPVWRQLPENRASR